MILFRYTARQRRRRISSSSSSLFIPSALLPYFTLVAAAMSTSGSATGDLSCNAIFSSPSHQIGLGTYLMDKSQVQSAIRSAIEIGYRRIDTAPVYFNEDSVGDALQEVMQYGLVERKDLFIVSKLPSPMHRNPELAVRKTLSDLRLDYLDLYLIHWPVAFEYNESMIDLSKRGYENEDIDDSANGSKIDPTVSIHDTWASMQQLVHKGLVRYVGVSNFPVILMHELLSKTSNPLPLVNQCEGHPYLQNDKLLSYCKHRNIHFQAYSPLGGSPNSEEPLVLLKDPVIVKLADKYQATPAQICIAWALQRGTSVVVKSVSRKHQEENWQASQILLEADDIATIAQLERRYRFFRPEEWWPDAALAVFD